MRLHVTRYPEAGHVGARDVALLLRVAVVRQAQPRVLPLRVETCCVSCLFKLIFQALSLGKIKKIPMFVLFA